MVMLHCDVVHVTRAVTTKWVSRLVLDHAIAAIQTSRLRPIGKKLVREKLKLINVIVNHAQYDGV